MWTVVVEVCHVLDQHCGEMAAVDDQDPVEQFPAGSSDRWFGDGVGLGCPHRARGIRMPSLANTASNMLVNLLSRSRIRILTSAARSPRSSSSCVPAALLRHDGGGR